MPQEPQIKNAIRVLDPCHVDFLAATIWVQLRKSNIRNQHQYTLCLRAARSSATANLGSSAEFKIQDSVRVPVTRPLILLTDVAADLDSSTQFRMPPSIGLVTETSTILGQVTLYRATGRQSVLAADPVVQLVTTYSLELGAHLQTSSTAGIVPELWQRIVRKSIPLEVCGTQFFAARVQMRPLALNLTYRQFHLLTHVPYAVIEREMLLLVERVAPQLHAQAQKPASGH